MSKNPSKCRNCEHWVYFNKELGMEMHRLSYGPMCFFPADGLANAPCGCKKAARKHKPLNKKGI